MPADSEIPDDLHRLNGIAAAMIDHVSFDADMDTLIETLLENPRHKKSNDIPPSGLRLIVRACVGGVLALVLLLVALVILKEVTGRALHDFLGSDSRVWLFSISVVLIGVFCPVVAASLRTRRLRLRYKK